MAGLVVALLSATPPAHGQRPPIASDAVPDLPGTIAIAAAGPNAGQAVFDALRAAEQIATGSIGGVAVMDVMLQDGTICSFQNFGRGGTATLFVEGERTGVEPPPHIAEARLAAVVSTGPRRPVDLGDEACGQEWPAGVPGVGWVVGHRVPDAPGSDGVSVDAAVMSLMRDGMTPARALEQVMGANPGVDAGLIAVSAAGEVTMRNSERVDARPDYGHARGEDRPTGAVIETILNEIEPHRAVAQVVVDVGLQTMTESGRPDLEIRVVSGLEVVGGAENLVEVDSTGTVTRIVSNQNLTRQGEEFVVVPYIHSRVMRAGRLLGYTVNEPLARVVDGVVQSVSFQPEMSLRVKRAPRACRFEGPHLTVCDALTAPPIPR